MYNKFLITLAAISTILIVAGYLWLNTMHTRDFNFGPPFIIMAGAVGLLFSLVGLLVEVFTKRSK